MTQKKTYGEVLKNPNFDQIERNILQYWQDEDIFQESVRQNEGNKDYVFYDGPPFANGLPHHGHLLTGYVKDTFARYHTMKGKKVERKFGWDCHGLPAEMEVEKEIQISGKAAIEEYGIDKFNDKCKKSVLKYTREWKEYVIRQGRFVDFDDGYKTMDKSYMESVLWAFKELYDKDLIYESYRVMPYSWACQTPLSNFETHLDNSYREKTSKSVTVRFEMNLEKSKDSIALQTEKFQEYIRENKKIFMLVWTTTPWTLPSNLALALGADIEYTILNDFEGNGHIISNSRKESYKFLEEFTETNIVITGKDLVKLSYIPLFPQLQSGYKDELNSAFSVYSGEFVTDSDGTGIVHIAPAFGEDDMELCNQQNIPTLCPVDESGCFTSEIHSLEYGDNNQSFNVVGKQVFDANDDIIIYLKHTKNWLNTDQYLHNYPHCWRTDTPLIYKAVPSFYVKVTKFRDNMVKNNQEINWIPDYTKNGLFGKWIENARDWSISRNRYWGCPVPVWKSDDPRYPCIEVYGSIAELEEAFGVKVENLHRPYIDTLVKDNPKDPSGKSKLRRVSDVLDCWFESGSMPFAQLHYPFENRELFHSRFPADFVVEYTAQTRGWFYTMMILATALFNKPPFLNCICHGVILDDKGQKLSKRLNNYTNPQDIWQKYGSDGLRWFMLSSPVMYGQELSIDKEAKCVNDAIKSSIKPFWNAYNFFCLYANHEENLNIVNIFKESNISLTHVLDQYIVSHFSLLSQKMIKSYDEYNLAGVTREFEKFIDILNNWYIRRSRERFWETDNTQNKTNAFSVLYSILCELCILLAPMLPFATEYIYRELTGKKSVHLEKNCQFDIIYEHNLQTVENIREISNAVHSLRNESNIRIRQPLSEMYIMGKIRKDIESCSEEELHMLKDETNVKEVKFVENTSLYAKEEIKLNFPILGKRIGKKIQELQKAVKHGNWNFQDGKLHIENMILESDEYFKILVSLSDDGAVTSVTDGVVYLNTEISQELQDEGIIRDIIRYIQQYRKDNDFDISNRISLSIYCADPHITEIINKFREYIMEPILAIHMDIQDAQFTDQFFSVDGYDIYYTVEKED